MKISSNSFQPLLTLIGKVASQLRAQHLSAVIVRNVFVNGLIRATTVVLSLITFALVARSLGPALYGYYAALYALLTLLDLTVEAALMFITVRKISQDLAQADRWVTGATILRTMIVLPVLVGYFVFVHFARYPSDVQTAAYSASVLLLVNIFRMPVALFRARLSMHYELAVTFAARLIEVLMIIGLVFYGGKLVHFFLARVLSGAIYSVLAWIFARSFFKIRFSLNLEAVRYLLLESLPLGLAVLLMMIQLKGDILLVSFLRGPVSGGLYGAIAQLPEYSLIVSETLIATVFPVLARFHAESARTNFQILYQRTFDMLMMLIIPVAVVITLMPQKIILLLFGSKFIASAPALKLLIWVIVLMYFGVLAGWAVVAINRQKSLVWIEMVDVVVYLTLNFLFIPRWDYMGAAVVRLLTVMIGPFLTYRVVQRRTGFSLRIDTLMKVIFCSLLLAGVILFLSPFHRGLAVAVGGILYVTALWFVCGIRALKIDQG